MGRISITVVYGIGTVLAQYRYWISIMGREEGQPGGKSSRPHLAAIWGERTHWEVTGMLVTSSVVEAGFRGFLRPSSFPEAGMEAPRRAARRLALGTRDIRGDRGPSAGPTVGSSGLKHLQAPPRHHPCGQPYWLRYRHSPQPRRQRSGT
ncbi:hypothetical protein F5884DRAFT_876737 [Xylogone sp. PMI_703]|nr:hypothetical protein F5884DRAFT_876737 [Xylogone sp. PMI_703]